MRSAPAEPCISSRRTSLRGLRRVIHCGGADLGGRLGFGKRDLGLGLLRCAVR